jgi:hypothetical protein
MIKMILLPTGYTDQHQRLGLYYLQQGRCGLTSAESQMIMAGFDLLHHAVVVTDQEKLSFSTIYQRYVDTHFADPYLDALLQIADVAKEHNALRARYARVILQQLLAAGFQQGDVIESNLLLAYCLYFWESFAVGYAFEVEIFRDLQASGIHFRAHDLRSRQERLSPYDLEVLGLQGDIKNSLYFLQIGREQGLSRDFYITRFYEGRRRYTFIVMVQLEAWHEIDGETIAGLLQEATRHFPLPVQVELATGSIVVADYTVWKQKVLRQQRRMEDADGR